MLVVFGVLPVVAAFFFVLSFLGEEEIVEPEPVEVEPVVEAPPPPPPEKTREVLAAARPLPVGTLIGPGDIVETSLDRADVHDQHIEPGDTKPHELNGWAVREALVAGAPLTRSVLVGPGQSGFLAAVLRPGTRAVTVRLGSSTRDAALVEPGDRVDVILSANLSVDGSDVTLVRTIVEDARVVAIDRRIVDPRAGESGDSAEGGEGAGIETATLEVSPSQGDRLVLGEQEGSLSLAVRSLAIEPERDPGEAVARIPGEVLGLEELLLSETADGGAGKLEERLLAEIAASEARLWAAISGDARPRTVRIIRGGESVDRVFQGQSPVLDLPVDALPETTPESGIPPAGSVAPRQPVRPPPVGAVGDSE